MLLHKKHSHPTRDALIEAVVWLLETKNPEDIRLDEVLSLSGISSGSLYHHFGDLSGLIDQAMIARYSDHVDISISALTQMVSHATDASSLAAGSFPRLSAPRAPNAARSDSFELKQWLAPQPTSVFVLSSSLSSNA